MSTPAHLSAILDVQETLHESLLTTVVRGRRRSDGLQLVAKAVPHTEAARVRLERLRYERTVLQHVARYDAVVPNVVRMVDWVDTGDALVLLLADSGGYALRDLLRDGPLPLEEGLRVAAGAAQGLAALHAAGVIHKDVSNNNIIYNRQSGAVELIDFGISSLLPREAQRVDTLWGLEGTPAYVSPEQTGRTSRPVDSRSDLYSLGASLYEMVTGRLPFLQEDLG